MVNTYIQRYPPFCVNHRCQDDQSTARPTNGQQDITATELNRNDEQVIAHIEGKMSTAAYELYSPTLSPAQSVMLCFCSI